jgi:CMP-N-acetylneuraminic acid synthetase
MKIGIFSCARIKSSRCPNKMLKNFSGTTLTDLILKKLKALNSKHSFFSGYENIFKKKCNHYNVRFVQRTKESSIIDYPASKIYNFIKNENYDYFLIINACAPFLKTSTIKKFIKFCKNKKKPVFTVFSKNNFYLNNKFEPVNFANKLKTINTKKTKKLYEFAHLLYFFEKKYFLKNGVFWDWKKVIYYPIKNSIETFDIDTEEEFIFAKKIWKKKIYK